MDPVDDDDDHALLYFIGGLVSTVFCLGTVSLFVLYRDLRKHPGQLMLMRALCDIMFNLCQVFSYVAGEPGPDSTSCLWLGLANQFSAFASNAWYAALSLDTFLAVRNPFSVGSEHLKMYHAIVWGTSIATCAVLGGANRWGYSLFEFCWIKVMGPSDLNSFSWALFYIPVMAFFFASIVVFVIAQRALSQGTDDTFEERRRALRNSRNYIAIFFLYWAFAGSVWIAQYVYVSEDDTKKYSLIVVFSVTMALRGVADFLNLLYYSRLTVRFCVRKAAHDILPSHRVARASSEEEQPLLAPVAVNDMLRRDMMVYSTWGIVECVNRTHANVPRTLHSSITFAWDPSEVVSRRMSKRRGIRGTYDFRDHMPVAFAHLRTLYGVADDDYLASFEFRDAVGANTRASASAGFAPNTAASTENIKLSLVDVRPAGYGTAGVSGEWMGEQGEHRERRMLESFTEGRGGSFFYFCDDQRFMVKTVSPEELEVLLRFLPRYCEHIRRHPDSLITRLYGLHGIRLNAANAWTHFIVMENCLQPGAKCVAKYDLKGSWVDRRALRPGKPVPGTLKDQDIPPGFTVGIGADRALRVRHALENDAAFLCDNGIMDYSLLIGVRRLDPKLPQDARRLAAVAESVAQQPVNPYDTAPTRERTYSQPEDKRFYRAECGGMIGHDGISPEPCVFHVGVIDFLQEYNLKKRCERFAKTVVLCKDGRGLSAAPTRPYRDRFIENVGRLFS